MSPLKSLALATATVALSTGVAVAAPAAQGAERAPQAQRTATALTAEPASAVLGPCNCNGGHPTISSGSQGAAVSHAQCLLKRVWGYSNVAIDGIFGPNTWDCLHP